MNSNVATISKHRLEALSDGVYAIALTLLVLELRLPHLAQPATDAALWHAIGEIMPKALSWLLSFWIVASFWLAQQRMFRLATALTQQLTFIELLQLSLITLVPFSTALMGDHMHMISAAAVYTGHLLLTAIVSWWRMEVFVRNKLLHVAECDAAVVRVLRMRAWGLLAFFALSFALAFVIPGYNSLVMMPAFFLSRVGRAK